MSKKNGTTLSEQLAAVKPLVKQVDPVLSNSNLENIFDRVTSKLSLPGLKEAVDLREEAFNEMEIVSELMKDPRFGEKDEAERKVAKMQSLVKALVNDAIRDAEVKNPRFAALKLLSETLKDHSFIAAWETEVRTELHSIYTKEFEDLELAQMQLEELRATLDPLKAEADKYAVSARSKFAKAQEIAKAINPAFKFPEAKKAHPVYVNGKEVIKAWKDVPA
jgi:hypothetical protein